MNNYTDYDKIDVDKLQDALEAFGNSIADWFQQFHDNVTHAFSGAFGKWDSVEGLQLRWGAAKLGMDTRELTDTELALKLSDAMTPFLEVMRQIAETDEFKQWQAAREYQEYWTEMHGEYYE